MLVRICLAATLIGLSLGGSKADDFVHDANYGVKFAVIPTNGKDANQQFEDRAKVVLDNQACGKELDFFDASLKKNGDGKPNGDVYPALIAKVSVLARKPFVACQITVLFNKDGSGNIYEELQIPSTTSDAEIVYDINQRFALLYGPGGGATPSCNNIVLIPSPPLGSTTPVQFTPNPNPRLLTVEFNLDQGCLMAEINQTLQSRVRVGDPGTDGAPCFALGTTTGDWDMAVYQLVRLVNLNERKEAMAFDATTISHLDDLLTISGELQADSYPIFGGCGNTNTTTGSAQDRADAVKFYDRGLFDDMGGLLKWLLAFLAITILVAAPALLAAASPAGQVVVGALQGALVAAGLASASLNSMRVPETENHLFMINTSQYLTNKRIIGQLSDKDDRKIFEDYNTEIKEWLLKRIQKISKEDFVEYNARPYARLSVSALLNIYDFSDDATLKTAAHIALDMVSAKTAQSSNLGRRIVPFRRLAGSNTVFNDGTSIFQLQGSADHLIAAMLLWSGQTQALPDQRISIWSIGQMTIEATSDYRPPNLILDVAINKSVPYEQRIHHAGWEITSSGKGWMVSAGGTSTDFAQKLLIASPIDLEVAPFHLWLKDENRGAGVPTFFFPKSTTVLEQTYRDFIRFEGTLTKWKKDLPTDPLPITFDHNLCVRNGFACGTNFVIPADPEFCFISGSYPAGVHFIDSSRCPVFADAPPFYMMLYRSEDKLRAKWGFFEVVDAEGLAFADFVSQMIARNTNNFQSWSAAAANTDDIAPVHFNSWRQDDLLIDVDAHAHDSDKSGILEVNGAKQADLGDWPLYDGDILQSSGGGQITIRRPGDTRSVLLDFSNVDQPRYVLFQ
ncbi:hypothetical protein [Bradyrhizobium sp. LB11.1]|uniref:hypothetical protein n=1 Tax=Bradyrhizobium sp. LB11.1 TaxID=3156326 RepID=UPI0033910336